MGSSQEKQDVEKLEKTNEGAIIKDISTAPMNQDIYVCGNYDNKFFQDYFIKDFSFDDFNEGNINRIGKIVILYFFDENINSFLNYFIKEYNQFKLPIMTIVGKKSDNEQLKGNINELIMELPKNRVINKNIFKFSNYDEEIGNYLINININLIESSSFYNELGDEYKYPKQFLDDKLFEEVIKNIFENFSTINILICGRAGVGKSTFINGILETTISRSRKGGECSQRIIKYIHRKLPITFYDSPGMSTETN